MKIINIFLKNLKQLTRDKKNLFLILIFPILIMLIYSTLLGGTLVDFQTENLGIVNLDNGNYSQELLNKIDELELDNKSKLFNTIILDNENEGMEKIKNEEISSMIIIPKNYSSNIYKNNVNSTLEIKGDPTSTGYMTTLTSINIILKEYSNEIQKNITNTPIKQINLIQKELKGMDSFDSFDYLAPGLIVFSILMNITAVTSSISEETENGMLKRLKLTKMKSSDYILGTSISWILIGLIEIITVLLTAIICGYHWQGGLTSIIIAIIVGMITIISSISLSLIIVSLTKNSSQASSLSIMLAFPLSIICGSFYPLPEYCIGTINGHPLQIYDILPWSQTITIFRQVLTFGKGLESVWPNIFLIIISGAILLLISIVLFKRKINNTN